MKLSKEKVMIKLKEVLDPELNISIVDLGLVYNVVVKKAKVKITMTLTTIGCPLISLIDSEIRNRLKELGILEKDIIIDLTFDPPWSVDKMSDKAKAMLGIG
ncbi:metal-sulfur cluster assembly factor [Patescibacteria group bacterium]|nr:metal-sulfur cluster assembly factor [Patescibacteria group bacterium]